jgi:sigma-B regulation protein RsbU (phosphoserine phosphatase)
MNIAANPGQIARPVSAERRSNILDCSLLIADDDDMCRRLLAGILHKQGFTKLYFAEGGFSALNQLKSNRFDLILLDMEMPDLDGLDVCKRIRARPELIDIPILMQTATVDRRQMGTLFAGGASDFLSKPINPSELIARVINHLERRCLLRDLREYQERTSRELDAACKMQLELLPSVAAQKAIVGRTGLRIASYFRPSSEIGGDIWGMLPINEASFGIFIADFTGHGVNAALNTFRLHALIHEYRHLHDDPAGLLAALNARLSTLLSLGQFATFLYMVIDHVSGRLRLASAGAPPPIVIDPLHGSPSIVEALGTPLGIIGDMPYELHERPFGSGATLLLFSDGLPENPDAEGNRIGEHGLLAAIDACDRSLRPIQLIERVCAAAGIRADAALPDDTTVICIDRRGDAAASPPPDAPRPGGREPLNMLSADAVDAKEEPHAA